MSKKNILNLFLLLIVAGLAGIIYFSEQDEQKLALLSTLDSDDIKSITIKRNNSTTVITRQTDDLWRIEQPVKVDANTFRINSILKLLNAPVHARYSPSDIDLTAIGLDQATTTIAFDEQKITFGAINPATGLRYINYDNNIYTIEDVYYPLLSSHFGTLVSLDLLPHGSKVKKLILINQTIEKDEKARWQSNIKISADSIATIIDSWQSTQAFGVHDYLERETLGEVYIYIAGQSQAISFIITDIEPWLIIARPELGLEYHLDIEAYDQLITPQ